MYAIRSYYGYQLQLEQCSQCGKKELLNSELSYNFGLGIFCGDCSAHVQESFRINAELFTLLFCLKNNKKIEHLNNALIEKAIIFMERHLKNHRNNFV